jgi:hypothetical protein
MPEDGNATFRIFDIAGREVWRKEAAYTKGLNDITVDAVKSQLKAGIYYYQLETANTLQSKKMIVID